MHCKLLSQPVTRKTHSLIDASQTEVVVGAMVLLQMTKPSAFLLTVRNSHRCRNDINSNWVVGGDDSS